MSRSPNGAESFAGRARESSTSCTPVRHRTLIPTQFSISGSTIAPIDIGYFQAPCIIRGSMALVSANSKFLDSLFCFVSARRDVFTERPVPK